MADLVIVKAAATALSDERTRKALGWAVVIVLTPVSLGIAFLCSLGAAVANQNVSMVELCFSDSAIPDDAPEEYRAYIEDMRAAFELLDGHVEEVNEAVEEGDGLDAARVKAVFYTLLFGTDTPSSQASRAFVDCFVTYEERTRTVTSTGEDGAETETEETYMAAMPVEDMAEVYAALSRLLGMEISEEQKANADSVYNIVRYGYAEGGADAGLPYIGVNGFCSPVGEGWRNIVISEFGNRVDPFTGERKGHSGMDLAVPTGTPVRAALAGTVTVSTYNAGGYGYYVMIDHGGGLATLYGHCSKLLASVGDTVEVGDVIALSGSTGRSTGPHLHFEVRINGERTDPRLYLP